MPTSPGVQPARYSEANLAIWSLAQWIAFLDDNRSRPEPAGPSVVAYSQPSHGRDQLELDHPRSFSRWREMNGAPVGNRTRLMILYPSEHSTETDPYWLGMTALVGQWCGIECLKRGRLAAILLMRSSPFLVRVPNSSMRLWPALSKASSQFPRNSSTYRLRSCSRSGSKPRST